MSLEKIATSFRLTKENREFLDDFAKQGGKSPSEVLRMALDLLKSTIVCTVDKNKKQQVFEIAITSTAVAGEQLFKLKQADSVAIDVLRYIFDKCKEPISENDFQKLRHKGDYDWLFGVALCETDAFFQSKGHLYSRLHPIKLKGWGVRACFNDQDLAVYTKLKDSMIYTDFQAYLDQKISVYAGISDDLYAETVKSMVDRLKQNCKTRRYSHSKRYCGQDPFKTWENVVSLYVDPDAWFPYLKKLNIIEDLLLEIELFSYFEFEGIYDKGCEYRPNHRYEILPDIEAEKAVKERKEIIEKLESIRFFKDIDYPSFMRKMVEDLGLKDKVKADSLGIVEKTVEELPQEISK